MFQENKARQISRKTNIFLPPDTQYASIFHGVQNEKKKSFIIGDLNLNCLNYNEDSNLRHFYQKVFKLGFFPLIDKPTKVCKSSATIIENILTNCVFDNTLKKV